MCIRKTNKLIDYSTAQLIQESLIVEVAISTNSVDLGYVISLMGQMGVKHFKIYLQCIQMLNASVIALSKEKMVSLIKSFIFIFNVLCMNIFKNRDLEVYVSQPKLTWTPIIYG